MSRLHSLLRQSLFLVVAMTIATWVSAKELSLPPETSALRESTLPGYKIAQQKCAICHSVDYISYQPPGMTLAQWTAEMTKMQHSYGAPISAEEVEQVGAYLAVAYGSARPEDPEVVAIVAKASEGKEAEVRTTSAVDTVEIETLLAANACTGCHAVDMTIVGPSFKAVASKYESNQDSLTVVMNSIRNGGAGKWGSIPMPAMPTLTEEELHALAEYVLAQ